METFNEVKKFNEMLITNLFGLNISDYFEKVYSKFFINIDTKLMKFLLQYDYNNDNF